MPYLKPAQLQTEWKTKKFQPVYIFAGEETFLLEESLRQLVRHVAADSLNFETFFGGDLSIDDVILAQQTLPFMADRRLIIVKDAHKIKNAETEKLAECLKAPASSSCLVLLWAEKMRKETKNSDLFSVAEKTGAVVEFRALYDRELPAWIAQKVTACGKRIAPNAIECLIHESGPGLLDLSNEIEKLSLFVGDATQITPEDVETVSGHTRLANLNQLAETVEAKKTHEALRILEDLLVEGEIPLRILATLYRCMRRLLIAASLQHEKGYSIEEVRSELRLHPYFDKSFFINLSRYRLNALTKNIELLMKADLELKSSSRPEHFVFEELLFALGRN